MTKSSHVTQSLKKSMKCGIFTNKEEQILLVHREEIIEPVIWVEYDKNNNTLTLVYEDGGTQDLGLDINKGMKDHLAQGKNVTLALLIDKEIVSRQETALVIKLSD